MTPGGLVLPFVVALPGGDEFGEDVDGHDAGKIWSG